MSCHQTVHLKFIKTKVYYMKQRVWWSGQWRTQCENQSTFKH